MSCSKKTPATPQEVQAALKLIELLYINGEIPHYVYHNIVADYYGKDIDITTYHIGTTPEAV